MEAPTNPAIIFKKETIYYIKHNIMHTAKSNKEKIRLTESQLKNIVMESVKMALNEANSINQSSTQQALARIQQICKQEMASEPDEYGISMTPVDEIIYNYFYDDDFNFIVRPRGLYFLTSIIVQYDLIALNEDGTISEEESNVPKLASLLRLIVPQDILQKVASQVLH